MSGMAMPPTNAQLAQIYWIFAGGAIVIATIVNIGDKLIHRQRIAAASKSEPNPARPKNALIKVWAAITALTRELSQATIHAPIPKYPQLNLPPLGRILLIGTNISLLLSIAFWKFNLKSWRTWEDIAVRCGHMTLTQLPLVFLMAGKRNIVGALTGTSYERLNWIHRWVARCMFITASCHMGFFLKSWGRYHYIRKKFELDIISRQGLGAWCVLLWIILSTFAPIRNIRYEFFVVQHVISYIGFTTIVMIHVPKDMKQWVWVPVGIYLTDRVVRTLYLVYNNISLFHKRKADAAAGLFCCRATFTALPDRATLVSIPKPTFKWKPGQHVFLHCPSITPLQSHPFTITTLPSDNKLEFVIRAHQGGTRRLFRHANESLPPVASKAVLVDGPYGRMRALEQFDTVVLVAGSTGATFTMPLLRDLVRRSCEGKIAARKVKFVWVVKNKGQVEWFAKGLKEAVEAVTGLQEGLVVEASVYITCDTTLTMDREGGSNASSISSAGASIEKPVLCGGDRCCCTDTVQEDEKAGTSTSSTSLPVPRNTCTCGMPGFDPANEVVTSIQAALSLPESVNIKTGRPALRALINKELEQARGEAAVVVCGPVGLKGVVRREVTGLCDERAVCKGSGADGVYLHVEGFGW
ncbi:hypothetical protein L211DRAFT_779183 [Terfezia boudieri ATCC MYA-4762]|uniref:ferric-chelate reductase (NADPH) n=1 Tax=Terfezia boudieri ATCC MYA-4762 TaxID=1051890 RepID=A0A3N4MEE1_9PEZI|nr:hypothetical protein L211DRAFT_779183 [Terfezia boudieri ATCC MYA-4762]